MRSFKKRILLLLLSVTMAAGLSACGGSSMETVSDSGSSEETSSLSQEPILFDTYVSNTVVATGSNTAIKNAEHITYRAWLPVEAAGEFDYCFYFSNTVDSTCLYFNHHLLSFFYGIFAATTLTHKYTFLFQKICTSTHFTH